MRLLDQQLVDTVCDHEEQVGLCNHEVVSAIIIKQRIIIASFSRALSFWGNNDTFFFVLLSINVTSVA